MIEVKITKEQFDYINSVRYKNEKKFQYISNILGDRYEYNSDTVFITYADTYNYYLVFEGSKKPSNKIQPSRITDRLKEN